MSPVGVSTRSLAVASETDLAATAFGLAGSPTTVSKCERALLASAHRHRIPFGQFENEHLAGRIAAGEDPLGEALCRMRSAKERRQVGAVYTPKVIVDAIVDWAKMQGTTPARVVDPGAGSGRFLLAAGRKFPDAELVAVESDPLAALILRANAASCGMADRLVVQVQDYRKFKLPTASGPTLFVGNPPYVRHHDISGAWKDWFAAKAANYRIKASRLAGLHVHFLFQTACLARTGDFGAFITAAEWLDVNYGAAARQVLVDVLGGLAVHVIAPAATPFPNADATGAVVCFRVGHHETAMRFREVETSATLGTLDGGEAIANSRLRTARRWSPFLRSTQAVPSDHIEVGELCRVHRGQVTGCNAAWIVDGYGGELPQDCLLPTVTRARELFDAKGRLSSLAALRRVIDLPLDLDELDDVAREQVERFLRWAARLGADAGYIAKHRRAWWAVQLRRPAPILCTYMARRPPAFIRNPLGARHLNIAHGLYPRESLPPRTLDALAKWLGNNVQVSSGRRYAGGLTKFEPKEVERIFIPPVEQLDDGTAELDSCATRPRR